MGAADVTVSPQSYVYGTIPATIEKKVPVLGLIAHMDTSPDASGKNVKPRIVEQYDGGDIVLNAEKHILLSPSDYPALNQHIGQDLIVTDGTTLLGADDKAGVAEIMERPNTCFPIPRFLMEPLKSVLLRMKKWDAGQTALMSKALEPM